MTENSSTDAVTGAFGYSGATIARELLAAGHQVRTLTGHPGRAPAGTPIDVRPLDFTDPGGLERDLRGAHTLYNTYWVRFPHGGVTHDSAVANSRVLFQAAARAGVRRIVHVSITHADPASPYPYFRGKGEVERHLKDTGLPHAIVRPVILFGSGGVLLNNIAWLLRRLPVFAVGGRGDYRVRPIHVDDLARLCTELGGRGDSVTLDAVGPESLAFKDMVAAIRHRDGQPRGHRPRARLADPAGGHGAGGHAARCPADRRGVPGDGRRPGRLERSGDRADKPHRLDRQTRRQPRAYLRERTRPPLPLSV